jgi:hypothetical protein
MATAALNAINETLTRSTFISNPLGDTYSGYEDAGGRGPAR